MTISTLPNNPQPSRSNALGGSVVNTLLTAAYTDGSAGQATSPTFFDTHNSKAFALSLAAASTSTGEPAATTDFAVDVMRSIDGGETWQLFASYSGPQELFVPCPIDNCIWQFRLKTKGTNGVRVRART